MARVPKDPAEGIKFSRFTGDNQCPWDLEIAMPKIKTKEETKDGNASTKKHHRPVRDGSDAREDLSSDFGQIYWNVQPDSLGMRKSYQDAEDLPEMQ